MPYFATYVRSYVRPHVRRKTPTRFARGGLLLTFCFFDLYLPEAGSEDPGCSATVYPEVEACSPFASWLLHSAARHFRPPAVQHLLGRRFLLATQPPVSSLALESKVCYWQDCDGELSF